MKIKNSYLTPARNYAEGIGVAVANRTINRKITRNFEQPEIIPASIARRDDMSLDHEVEEYCLSNGYVIDGYHVVFGDDMIVNIELSVTSRIETEKWEDVAQRVAVGNTSLTEIDAQREFHSMHHHLRQASLLMSGRHLQHGDATQFTRNQEVFTNCSTSALSFLSFYLLLNGSGVGRAFDNDLMKVDWGNMPIVITVIDQSHKDVQSGEITAIDIRNARHLYAHKTIHEFEVPDSREGWAKAFEKIEVMAYEGLYKDDVLILDFSKVRPRGAPIGGMQDRPASGPGPLMSALDNVARIRNAEMPKWRQAMYVDHYSAECVLVGGARRAARMSTKTWRDHDVFEFIGIKRGNFLWSSNNSVTVDEDFWRYVKGEVTPEDNELLVMHAKKVLNAIAEASYYDQTGEPGLINVHKLTQNDEGMEEVYKDGDYIGSQRYTLDKETLNLTKEIADAVMGSPYKMIVNPCGEIALIVVGGYCVIADTVPYHTQNDDDAEDLFRVTTRALMRTNLMDCLYRKEVARTNRIGVGITGLHEYIWKRFGYGWKDIVDEERSRDMWMMLSRFKRAVNDEAKKYAAVLGVAVPHTNTTLKPAGTTSKLFGLTEGAHLPSMREYLRWVQFRNDDPLVDEYREKGYPIKKLETYSGTTIVGFPTRPEICTLGMGDKLVTAAEATPEEQYEYLRLLEKYWITGVDEQGNPLTEETGNQVSYTLKYNPEVVDFKHFKETLIAGQSTIRCCSVMPQTDATAYEYQPEQPVNKHEYQMITDAIRKSDGQEVEEDIGKEHIDCAGGACPVDFGTNAASRA